VTGEGKFYYISGADFPGVNFPGVGGEMMVEFQADLPGTIFTCAEFPLGDFLMICPG
jgi:hypothetical protein